jgi:hypothetical protein
MVTTGHLWSLHLLQRAHCGDLWTHSLISLEVQNCWAHRLTQPVTTHQRASMAPMFPAFLGWALGPVLMGGMLAEGDSTAPRRSHGRAVSPFTFKMKKWPDWKWHSRAGKKPLELTQLSSQKSVRPQHSCDFC